MGYKEDFLKWKDDNSYIKDYEGHSFPDNYFLIRVYLYTPPQEKLTTNILNFDGTSASAKKREVLVPYAKVIAKGDTESKFYSALEPGDIVAIPDKLTQFHRNPHYDQWMEAMKERPAPEGSPPPPYIGAISNWYPYQFIVDKLNTSHIDDDIMDMTFLLPQANLISKIDDEFFEQYKEVELNEVEV
jgi:hypothetical protein